MYVKICKDYRLNIGEVLALVSVPDRIFMCFPTVIIPQKCSEFKWIEDGLLDLIQLISSLQIKSLVLPALGCGLGGPPWQDVQPLIEKHLGNVKIPVHVYLPR